MRLTVAALATRLLSSVMRPLAITLSYASMALSRAQNVYSSPRLFQMPTIRT